jgi:hypothetical protein
MCPDRAWRVLGKQEVSVPFITSKLRLKLNKLKGVVGWGQIPARNDPADGSLLSHRSPLLRFSSLGG